MQVSDPKEPSYTFWTYPKQNRKSLMIQDPILKNRITSISLLHFCACDLLPGQHNHLLALEVKLGSSNKQM